jgi:hypothetical protein
MSVRFMIVLCRFVRSSTPFITVPLTIMRTRTVIIISMRVNPSSLRRTSPAFLLVITNARQNGNVLSALTVDCGTRPWPPSADALTLATTVTCFRFALGLVTCQTRM